MSVLGFSSSSLTTPEYQGEEGKFPLVTYPCSSGTALQLQ